MRCKLHDFTGKGTQVYNSQIIEGQWYAYEYSGAHPAYMCSAQVHVRKIFEGEGCTVAYDFVGNEGTTGNGTMRLDHAQRYLRPIPRPDALEDEKLSVNGSQELPTESSECLAAQGDGVAGMELDVMMAEHVMKWKRVQGDRDKGDDRKGIAWMMLKGQDRVLKGTPYTWGDSDGLYDRTFAKWSPSTSIADAFEVVEKMQERGFGWHMGSHRDGWLVRCFEMPDEGLNWRHTVKVGVSITQLICLSSLAALDESAEVDRLCERKTQATSAGLGEPELTQDSQASESKSLTAQLVEALESTLQILAEYPEDGALQVQAEMIKGVLK